MSCDVARDGYWASIHVVEGGRPYEVRNYVRTRRPKPVGVLAVGAVAAPWFEIGSDQFPCDLYYMDINGAWIDSDRDGLYNAHKGHVNPEIWFGRLWSPTKGGNDANLINDYFARNHAFRLGRLGHAHSALAYVDDDWKGFADCAIDSMFPPADIFDKTGGGKNLGLTALASAKSGSMLFFEDFYKPLGEGKVIGDAYVDWWKMRGPTHDDFERYWFYGMVLLGDPTLTWPKGNVPQQLQPQMNDVFDHWPRKMELRWDQVNVPGVKYSVEVDAHGAVSAGKWAEEVGRTFAIYKGITKNKLDHTFVGAQRGRWRVRAEIDGMDCSWSPWSYFRFTV